MWTNPVFSFWTHNHLFVELMFLTFYKSFQHDKICIS
jgi:hypothetical protein